MIKNLLVALAACFCSFVSYSQDFSNKGKEFWLCFPHHVRSGTVAAKLSIWITSDKASSGTITMPNSAFSSTFSIAANGIAEIQVPYSAASITAAESTTNTTTNILKKSIHVQVNPGQPAVVAYVQQFGAARSAASLLLPVNVLGKKYYAVSFTQSGTGTANGNGEIARSQFQIIATKNNTVVTITPRKNGVLGTPFTVTFPLAGDMIQYQSNDAAAATQDLTGTLIESVASGTGGCLPIAVFSGSSYLTLGRQAVTVPSNMAACTGGSFDPLFQQCYPVSTWGKSFGFVPFANYPAGVPFRVLASEDNTKVYFNGTLVATLNQGQIYPTAFTAQPQILPTASATYITADKPICVTEYMQSSGCAGNTTATNQGDPDMVILNPIEQNISDITVFSTKQEVINTQWANILIKTTGIPSFRISRNGGPLTAPTGTWQTFTALPGYSYLRQQLTSPAFPSISDSYRFVSDSGFNAIAYGLGDNETYAYSAGTNVKDLYQQIAVQTQYGIEQTPSVCTGSPFKFKISLPYKPLQLIWNLQGLPASATLPNNTNVTQNPIGAVCATLTGGEENTYVCHDSVTVVNGKQIWWYSLPLTYTINQLGVYPIVITAQTGGADGCGSEQEINFDLQVSDPPIADFTFTIPGCSAQPVQFSDATISVKPNYHWYWDFGDASPVSNAPSPSHTYPLSATTQTYTVRFSSITTPGCLSDTIQKTITIKGQPNATIAASTTAVCQNGPSQTVTFTPVEGTAPYTYSYTLNTGSGPGPVQTTTNSTITVPTTTPGTYIFNLTGIANANATYCSTPIANQTASITVNPLPTASLTGTIIVCQNSTAPPVTFTGTNGTAPYTISYTLNGIAQTPVVTSSTIPATATVNAPTNVFGNFVYQVTGITDATATACNTAYSAPTAPSVNVKVEAMPTATLTGGVSTCTGGMQPVITFTATGGTEPYTFTYHIVTNSVAGPNLTTQSTGGGIKTLIASSAVAGTFQYVLTNVQSGDGTICSTNLTGVSTTVQVNPLPTATISGTATVCQNTAGPTNIIFTGANGTAPYTINYTINGVAQPALTTTGSTATVAAPTAAAGSFVYAITDITDATATACSTTYPAATAPSATVLVNERPTATIAGDAEVCLNAPPQTITFTATGGVAPYIFTYNINGLLPNQTLNSLTAVATLNAPTTTAGTFVYNLVSVTESSSNACVSAQPVSSATVIVNPKPTASYTINGPFCEQKAITFTPAGSVSSGAIVSWVWDYGDGTGTHTLTNGNPFTVTYTTTGPKTATVKTITAKGCESDVYTQTFTVNARPDAGFVLPEVCLLDPFAQFTDTSKPVGGIAVWQWTFNDPSATPGNPNTSGAQHATHTYSAVGPYPVELIVTSTQGCKDTVTQTLVINGGNPSSQFNVQNAAGLCSGTAVTIQNKSTIGSGSITKLEIYWDNAGQPTVFDLDDDPFFDELYTHSYPTLTTNQNYTVRVRAYSGGVCFSDRTQLITVHGKPNVQFNAIPDICLNNGTVQLTQGSETGSVPGGPGVYSGSGVSSTGLFTPAAVGPGTYTLTYTYTSSFGCVDSKTQTVKVLTAPVAVFTAGTACEQSPVTFTQNSTSTEGAITQWIWNFEGTDELHTDGLDVTHTFSTPGIKTVTLTVITAGGCKSTVTTHNITVNPKPAPNFTFTASACLPNATIVFTNSTPSSSDNRYLWNFDYPSTLPANSSSGISPTHVYTAVGPYIVRLVATNNTTGCSAFIDKIVNSIHPAPLASFDFDKLSICVNQSVNVIDHSTGADGTISNWTWYFGDNTPAVIGQVPGAHTYTQATTFDVKLNITNNFGCTDDSTRKFTVYPYPDVNAGADQFVLEGGSAVLQPTVTAIDPQYLWTSSTSSTYLNDVTALNPVTRPLTDVTYTLTVTGKGGCAANDDVFIKLLKFPEIPNTFTPNNDGIHDFWDINYLFTYPNNRVQVFSRTGQLVFESKGYSKPWDGNMNGKSLPVDTYYYIIEPGYGRKPITGYVTIIK